MPFAFTASPTLAELVCRAALPKDTPAVLELTRHIWDGHDYIPSVWQEWLADEAGFLAVAEYGERLAGIGKLTRLAEDEWWLEGLRVHPDFEGKGVATHIHRYLMGRWQALGKGVIRLATASKRVAVQRICAKLGFQKVAEFAAYEKATENAPKTTAFRVIEDAEAEIAYQVASQSPLLPFCFNLLDLGWQWANPRLSYFKAWVATAQAFWWQQQAGVLCIEEDHEESQSLTIRWVACAPQALCHLLRDFSHFAAQNGYEKATWIAPLQPLILNALAEAAYTAAWDFSLYLYEYRPEAEWAFSI